MDLPDRFEQVGILVGTVFLISLPVSALGTALFGLEIAAWQAISLWAVPGITIGGLLAADRLPVTYHQVWVFALSSWLLALGGWTLLGVSMPPLNRGRAVIIWLFAVGIGAVIAWIRPVRTIRRSFFSS